MATVLGAPPTVEIGCQLCHEVKVAQIESLGTYNAYEPLYGFTLGHRLHQSEHSAKERFATDWEGSEKRLNSIYNGGFADKQNNVRCQCSALTQVAANFFNI